MLLNGNYDDEVIPFSPTLLVCFELLLQMVIHSVFLRNARSWLGIP
jgi:hypothetical protein